MTNEIITAQGKHFSSPFEICQGYERPKRTKKAIFNGLAVVHENSFFRLMKAQKTRPLFFKFLAYGSSVNKFMLNRQTRKHWETEIFVFIEIFADLD